MRYSTILFDLDGTLLPMDVEEFTRYYFRFLAAKVAHLGYTPEQLIPAIWKGTEAMMRNDGSASNEEVFWKTFSALFGEDKTKDIPVFSDFYENEFNNAKAVCGYNETAISLIRKLQQMGQNIVLATNPIFPHVALNSRLSWIGLTENDFMYATYYENCSSCKPNPLYFKQLLEKLGLRPEECLMVGNDAKEDTCCTALGIDVFLIDDCLINKENAELSQWKHGSFEELSAYLGL